MAGSRISGFVDCELAKEVKRFHSERARNLDNASFGSTVQLILEAGLSAIYIERGQAPCSHTKPKVNSDKRTKGYRLARFKR